LYLESGHSVLVLRALRVWLLAPDFFLDAGLQISHVYDLIPLSFDLVLRLLGSVVIDIPFKLVISILRPSATEEFDFDIPFIWIFDISKCCLTASIHVGLTDNQIVHGKHWLLEEISLSVRTHLQIFLEGIEDCHTALGEFHLRLEIHFSSVT